MGIDVFLYGLVVEQSLEHESSLQRECSQVMFVCAAQYHISMGFKSPEEQQLLTLPKLKKKFLLAVYWQRVKKITYIKSDLLQNPWNLMKKSIFCCHCAFIVIDFKMQKKCQITATSGLFWEQSLCLVRLRWRQQVPEGSAFLLQICDPGGLLKLENWPKWKNKNKIKMCSTQKTGTNNFW